MKIALIQLRSGRDHDANVTAVSELVAEAAGAGARYIQTPEMTTLIERDRARMQVEISSEKAARAAERFSELAAQLNVHLHIGSMAVPQPDGRFANRAHLFGPDGGLITTYDKIHMFDVDLDGGESWRESALYAPGDRCVVADLGRAQLGLGICYDLRFAALARAQAQAGAQIITYPAAFTRQTGEAHWHVLLRARAIETGSYVVAAAQGGHHEDDRETFGHSLVIDPWGRVVAEKADDTPGVLHAVIDVAAVTEARGKIPALRHDRDFAVETVGAATPKAVA